MSAEAETFAQFAAKHGWGYQQELIPEMETDAGEVVGGFVARRIFKYVEIDGERHVYWMDSPAATEPYPAMWALAVDQAEAGLARYLGEITE